MMNEQFKASGVPVGEPVSVLEEMLVAVRTAGMEQHVTAMLGEEMLQVSAEPTRLVSLCAAVEYLAAKNGGAELVAAGEKAAALKLNWMDGCYASVERRVHFLNSIVKMAGLESQGAFLERYRIFMDGSILCSEGISQFLDRLLPAMAAMDSSAKITVPHCVVKQLEGLTADDMTMELSGAKCGLEQLRRIQEAQLLSVRGDENDTTTMSTFISAFSRFKPSNNLVLLTEDSVLAAAVETLNAIGIEGDDILVATLSTDGIVRCWGEPEEELMPVFSVEPVEEPAPVLPAEPVEELAPVLPAEPVEEPVPVSSMEAAEVPAFSLELMEEPEMVPGFREEPIMLAEEEAAAIKDSNATVPYADFCEVPFDEALDGGHVEDNAEFLTPVPMDVPLDGGNTWVPQVLPEQDEDDDDDTNEEKLEKYLQISGLLQLSDDEEDNDDEFFLTDDEADDLEEEIVFLEEDDEAFAEDMILLDDIEQFDEHEEDDKALLEQDEELFDLEEQTEPALRMLEQIGSLEEIDELEGLDENTRSVTELEWDPLD